MSFKRSEMLYDNGTYYKWTASKDYDDPHYRGGIDHDELNRTEGYEVLYMINKVVKQRLPLYDQNKAGYQKVEKLIRFDVPTFIKSHKGISDWIIQNWN